MNAPQPAASAGFAHDTVALRRGISQAGDAQVHRVVRTVDALQDRGAADALLDPVRPRLRAMHLARPLRFARLLFMPLDPLVVAPRTWRPGSSFLPRTALVVLARAVRTIMAGAEPSSRLLDRVDALTALADTTQTAAIRQAGQLLWPEAAIALRRLGGMDPTLPSALPTVLAEGWVAQGLPCNELQPTVLALAPVLDGALALHDLGRSRCSLSEASLLDLVVAAGSAGQRACGMVLSLILIRASDAGPALLDAVQTSPALKPAMESAVSTALDWIEAEEAARPAGSVGEAAALDLGKQAALLEALSRQPGDPARRRRAVDAKARLLAGSLNRFEASLQEKVADPLVAIPADPAERGAVLDSLEDAARTLHRFQAEARRLGETPKFDALLHQAVQRIAGASRLSAMDRARLMEIIVGPDVAVSHLTVG